MNSEGSILRGSAGARDVSAGPVKPEPAATVVLVREMDSGLEVYLTRRQDNLVFLPGFHVFPGGRLDEHDSAPETLGRCRGLSGQRQYFRIPGRHEDENSLAYPVAAIRELFEEAGVLLACDEEGRLITGGCKGPGGDDEFWQRLKQAREKIHQLKMSMTEMMKKEGLYYALDELMWFANWVTPATSPRRFDTQFFLALHPEGQRASVFSEEVSASEWIEPEKAIRKWRQGEIKIIPPTLASLDALVRYQTWSEIRDDLEKKA
jgi:8-oxo-dGTP pyrophosphatase MutT (NUDIX family)